MNNLKLANELNQSSLVMDNLSTLNTEFEKAKVRVKAISAVKDENNETFIGVFLKDIYPHENILKTLLPLKMKGLHMALEKLSSGLWDYQILFRVSQK